MIIKNMGLYWRPEDVFWGRQGNPQRLLGYAKLDQGKFVNPDVEDTVENESEPNKRRIRNMDWMTVNFRKQIGVYALYQDFKIVYVGQAGDSPTTSMFARLRAHKGDHLAGRWNMFSWFGLKEINMIPSKNSGESGHDLLPFKEDEKYKCSTIIDHLEGILIEVLENIENKQAASFGGTVKFLQKRDLRLPKTMNEMIDEIHEKLGLSRN
jgi:hypothetical protein